MKFRKEQNTYLRKGIRKGSRFIANWNYGDFTVKVIDFVDKKVRQDMFWVEITNIPPNWRKNYWTVGTKVQLPTSCLTRNA